MSAVGTNINGLLFVSDAVDPCGCMYVAGGSMVVQPHGPPLWINQLCLSRLYDPKYDQCLQWEFLGTTDFPIAYVPTVLVSFLASHS